MSINFNNHYGFSNPYNQRGDKNIAFKSNAGMLDAIRNLAKRPDSVKDGQKLQAEIQNLNITDDFLTSVKNICETAKDKKNLINGIIDYAPKKYKDKLRKGLK